MWALVMCRSFVLPKKAPRGLAFPTSTLSARRHLGAPLPRIRFDD